MKIANLEAGVYRVPLGKVFTDAIHRMDSLELIIAKITTDDGIEGSGWTYTLGDGGTAMKALLEDAIGPMIANEDAGNIERLWDMVWRRLHGIGSSGFISLALAAMDIALWDIQGKARGLPLFRLLGGHRDSVPVYGSGINLYYTMDELLDQVKGVLAKDVHGVKIKVGRPDLGEDIERIAAVREVMGPHLPLMLDANQGWFVGEAINRARAFEPYNPFWLEEPILADDHIGYEELARSINVPIATGETHYTRFQFADLFQRRAVAFVQADVYRVGGITEWMKIAGMAQSLNLPMCPHGMEEIHTHLTCAVSNGYIVEHIVSGGGERERIYMANPLKLSKGFISPHDTPGHGVEFDEAVLSRCKVA